MSSFRRESVVSRLRVALVALSAFLIVGESVFASSSLAERLGERWRWRVFDREEGLHRGMITAMDQNSDDYIYAASERGLSRYDLHHWEIVESSEALDDGPIVSIVEGANAIYCASRHSVWLARGGTRLDRLHPVSEPTSGSVFLAASRLGEVFVIDGASHYRVRERVERVDDGVLVPGGVLDYEIDADGVHWIATEAGLRYRDLAGQQARWLEVRAPDLPFPDASCVRLLRVDSPPRVPLPRPQRVSSRELWGVFRIDRERAGGFRLARLEGRDWIPLDAPALDSPPDGIVRDPRGSYVITCESGRLYVLDVDADADSTPRWIGVQELGIGPVKLHGGILDSRGTLWFRLGAGGVASVDTRSERWERLAVPRVASPPYPRVTSLLEERDGSVWAGTTDFLLRYPSTRDGELADEPEVFHTILETPLRDVTALGEQTRESFLPSRIWIGSESFQGLFFYEPRGDETPRANGEASRAGSWGRVQLDDPIHKIRRDRRGELWFLPGASRRSRSVPKLYRLSLDAFDERTPSPVTITSASSDVRPSLLAVNDIVRVPGPRDDVFWLATEDGLLKCHLEREDLLVIDRRLTEADGLVSARVWAVEEGPDGSIWLCYPSSGRGVTRLREGESVETFDVRDGLAGPDVWSIVRAGPSIWFGTNAGLSRYDDDGVWYSFPVASEDARTSFVIPILVSGRGARGDTLFVGTAERGLYRFRLDDERRPRFRKISFPERVREGDRVTFRWRARDYKNETPPERLIYRWRLDGGAWTQVAAADHVDLGNGIAPGRHTFELEVRDLDGNRNRDYSERLHEFEVVSRSGWWTPAMRAFAGSLVVGALAILLVHLRSRRRARRVPLDRYRRAWLGAPYPVLLLDRDGRVVDYNGRDPSLLGLRDGQAEEILGRPLDLVPAVAFFGFETSAGELALSRPIIRRASAPRVGDRSASDREIELWGFPLDSGASEEASSGAIILVRDVTREASAERLRGRERRLRAIRDFLERLEVRTLRSLERTRRPDVLEDDDTRLPAAPQPARERDVIRSADRLAPPMRALGRFVRPDVELERITTVETDAFFASLLDGSNGAEGAVRVPPGMTLDARIQTGVWPVRADRKALAEILGALIENAIEAMPDGGALFVGAENVRLEGDPGGLADGPYVEVTIRDEGAGIEPERADVIFDPLYSTKARDDAEGLGLSLAWRVARALGGDIRIESARGRGAAVKVWLPAA